MAGDLDAVLRVLERQNPRREDGMTAVFSFDLEAARRASAEFAALRSRLAEAERLLRDLVIRYGNPIGYENNDDARKRAAAFLASGEGT